MAYWPVLKVAESSREDASICVTHYGDLAIVSEQLSIYSQVQGIVAAPTQQEGSFQTADFKIVCLAV